MEKNGNKGSESSIDADLFDILENLLILAEEIVVQGQRIAILL
jgi:hypothetical protein